MHLQNNQDYQDSKHKRNLKELWQQFRHLKYEGFKPKSVKENFDKVFNNQRSDGQILRLTGSLAKHSMLFVQPNFQVEVLRRKVMDTLQPKSTLTIVRSSVKLKEEFK